MTDKELFEKIKRVLTDAPYKLEWRDRSGKHYVRIIKLGMTNHTNSGTVSYNLRKIITTAWPKAYCTSGSSYDKTFRVN